MTHSGATTDTDPLSTSHYYREEIIRFSAPTETRNRAGMCLGQTQRWGFWVLEITFVNREGNSLNAMMVVVILCTA